jgi:hypothetical protein
MSPAESTESATRQWRCATCGISVNTRHCPGCGEKVVESKDLTFLGLMTQVFQNITSVDSRLLRSLRVLMTRPGAITAAYVDGPRKPYIGPFQLFLIVNVIFFAVQSFSGSRFSPRRCTRICLTRIGVRSLERWWSTSCRPSI